MFRGIRRDRWVLCRGVSVFVCVSVCVCGLCWGVVKGIMNREKSFELVLCDCVVL